MILLVVALAFLPTLRHNFVNWDDPQNITANEIVMSPTWTETRLLLTQPVNSMYSPLVFLSFIADAWVSRGNPWSFHLTNLLLHLLATAAVFLLLRHLFSGARWWVVGAGALLFATHPLQAEPVSWATGRKDVLAGALALWAICLHLWGTSSGSSRKRILLVAGGTLLFALALLAKATSAALPLLLLAVLVYIRRQPFATSLLYLLPWFLLAAVIGVVATRVEALPGWIRTSVTPAKRPLLAGYALGFYGWKFLLPIGLSPVYRINAIEAARFTWSIIPLFAFLGAGASLLLRKQYQWFTALVCFVVPLLPVLGFVPFLYQQISLTADRYAYLSLLGGAMALVLTMQLFSTDDKKLNVVTLAAAILLLVLGALTNHQSRNWRNSETLWRHAITVAPGVPEAHTNLAYELHHAKKLTEAEQQLELAVKADPTFNSAWNLLGLLRLQRGAVDEALPALQQTVTILVAKGHRDKLLADAYNNLGVALLDKGRFSEAAANFEKSLEIVKRRDVVANLADARKGMAAPPK